MQDNKKVVKNPEKKVSKPSVEKKIIRIAESDLDGSKKLEHALIGIKGVSWSYAHALREALNFENKPLGDFSEADIEKIKDALKNPQNYGLPSWVLNRRNDPFTGKSSHLLASDLILSQKMDIRFLKAIKCYRGVRHSFNYKSRGQKTRSHGANYRGRVGLSVGVSRKKTLPEKSAEKK